MKRITAKKMIFSIIPFLNFTSSIYRLTWLKLTSNIHPEIHGPWAHFVIHASINKIGCRQDGSGCTGACCYLALPQVGSTVLLVAVTIWCSRLHHLPRTCQQAQSTWKHQCWNSLSWYTWSSLPGWHSLPAHRKCHTCAPQARLQWPPLQGMVKGYVVSTPLVTHGKRTWAFTNALQPTAFFFVTAVCRLTNVNNCCVWLELLLVNDVKISLDVCVFTWCEYTAASRRIEVSHHLPPFWLVPSYLLNIFQDG